MELNQQILEKSRDLFMRYGIKSVTMDDIAREMGISKKTLYQFVNNKADLIEKIFRKKIEEEKSIMNGIREASTNAIDEILHIAKYVIQQLRELSPTIVYDLQKYYRNTWRMMESLHQAHIYQIIRENLVWGIEEGLYREKLNPDIIAKLYVGKTALVVDDELFPAQDYNPEQLYKEYINYHIHGVASPKGLEQLHAHMESVIGESW